MEFRPEDDSTMEGEYHSRKLLSYHCSGSDTVLGSVNVGGSVVLLLFIGFVVGFGAAWFVFWRRQRRQMRLDLEYRDRFSSGKKEVPDVSPMVQAAAVPVPIARANSFRTEPKLPQTAASLASGPLAIGVRESGVGPLPTKQPLQTLAQAQPPLRTSSGNPFAGVESYNVVRNPTTSMESSPGGLAGAGPLGRSISRISGSAAGLQSSKADELIPAAHPTAAPAIPLASQSFARRTTDKGAGLEAEPVHARSDTMLVNPLAGSGASDYVAAVTRTASGNPFGADSKQAQKQDLLEQVRGEEYDEGDLDPEWLGLLQELDSRLCAAGKPALNSKERAVAIRSLIVATASQSPEAAIAKAVQDVQVFRKTQQFRAT